MNSLENIQVVRYTPDKKEEWNAFVANSKNGTFLFDRDFMEYHADRFTDFSLMVYLNDKLVAVFPANVKDEVVYSHQGLSYGGLIIADKTNFVKRVAYHQGLITHLTTQGVEKLIVKPLPSFYQNYSDEEALLFNWLKAAILKKDIYCYIDTSIENSINRNRKRAIKRADSKGIEVRETEDYKEFWDLILTPNLNQRFGVNPVHSLEEIHLLKEKFPNNIRFWGSYDGNKLTAGVVMFLSDEVAHFQYSSGTESRAENGDLDLLFERIVCFYKPSYKYISFGSSTHPGGSIVNLGVLQWKESFGAINTTQSVYEIALKNVPNLNTFIK